MAETHSGLNASADALGLWEQPRHEAIDAIVRHYADVAAQAASQRVKANPRVPREDFASAARVGLWQAALRYDRNSAAAFTTYCQRRIWGAMADLERDADWAPSKIRKADKLKPDGAANKLPVMFPIDETAKEIPERPEQESEAHAVVKQMLAETDPAAASILETALSVDLDHNRLADLLGVTRNRAHDLYVAALASARTGEPFRPPRSRVSAA